MDSSVSTKDEIWFLRVCHHISKQPTTDVATSYSHPLQLPAIHPSTLTSRHNYIAPYAVFSPVPNIQAPSAMYQLSLLSPPITLCSSKMTSLPQAIAPCNLPCSSSTLQSLSPIYCWTQPSNSLKHLSLSLSLQKPNPQPHSATNTLDICQPLPCK